MYLFRYIKDVTDYMKTYPFKEYSYHKSHTCNIHIILKGRRLMYLRNALYVCAQPKYLLGRIITKLLER